MPLLKNPSGRIVDVNPDRVDKLLANGFQRVDNTPQPAPAAPPVKSQPIITQETDSELVYSYEEGNNGWFTILENGQRVTSVRGEKAAQEKVEELNN